MRFLFYISQNYSLEILRPLEAEMRAAQHDVRWFVESEDVDKRLLNQGETLITRVEEAVAYQPDATFLPGNVVPSFIPGLKVQIFHGFEWKKKGHFRIRDCFDLYCTQGPFFTRKFLQLRENHPHFTVKETGWPKLDPLFEGADKPSQHRAPTILYAPTFSPSFSSATALLEQIQQLSQRLPWNWIVKFHPKMDPAIVEQYRQISNDKLQVSDSSSLLPLLQSSDVMVSDTSSAITEFLLLHKPVVTYNNSQPESVLLNITAPDALEGAITRALSEDSELKQQIEEYGQQMHPYTDGQSAARVLQATLDELAHFPRKENRRKPKNWFRNFKLRKQLNYWK